MVICKFFASGYCKFGDRCYYDHNFPKLDQRSSRGNSGGFSFMKTLQQIDQNRNEVKPSFSFNEALKNISQPNHSSFFAAKPSNMVVEVDMESHMNSGTSVFKGPSNFQFGGGPTAPVHSTSLFPTHQPSQQITENKERVVKSLIYSPISELSEEDLTNFKSNEFNSPIPLCPPPFEYCF